MRKHLKKKKITLNIFPNSINKISISVSSFAMFYSKPPYADLIFQDAATQLAIIPPSQRWYSTYLGKDFMRAKRIVDCYASAWQQKPSKILVSFFILLALILSTKGFHMN